MLSGNGSITAMAATMGPRWNVVGPNNSHAANVKSAGAAQLQIGASRRSTVSCAVNRHATHSDPR